jgi:integrase
MKSLRDALPEYLAIRHALGTQLKEGGMALSHFLDFMEAEGAEVITLQIALRWAMLPADVERATWARRLGQVRGFAVWRSSFDPRTEVPPDRMLGARRQRNPPHIYTEKEVLALMAGAAKLPKGKIRPWTYRTLLGLLASTGLRPGEALALDMKDVDLQTGILTIRETKFGKTRFVPLSESTQVALADYARRRETLCRRIRTEAFFLTPRGNRLRAESARQTLAELSCAIGLRQTQIGGRLGRGPRLQDFRHTFATMRMIEWYRAGLDVSRELPKLSTYLGHTEICHTYWYLQAIPELLQLAASRLEGTGKGVAP